MMAEIAKLTEVRAGMEILFGGDRIVRVPENIAANYRSGDALRIVEATGELLLIPEQERKIAADTVARAADAFRRMGEIRDSQISQFFESFAAKIESDDVWTKVSKVNDDDVVDARRRGRSTTRLVANDKLRRGMIDGLRGWIDAPSKRGQVVESISHEGWKVDLLAAELGVVGFVFEGRPNVLADATGVLRGGNTVVFRIGRDALRTAQALMGLALVPALRESGLPEGAVCLVESPEHAAGWALFSDRRLALAVARGSGSAVATLGALAQQAGVSVSLHGTGGAWLVASSNADRDAFAAAVLNSLDRKVCNTLNVCCIEKSRSDELIPTLLRSLDAAGQKRGQTFKLHVVEGDHEAIPHELLSKRVSVRRAEGDVEELQAEPLPETELGREWEWEDTPEVTLKIVDNLQHAVDLFNRYSPQFIACLVSEDQAEQESFYQRVNAPFVGNGFSRWVDGQYALLRPELGLSNWQNGRLFGRGAVLSGDSVFTVRARVTQSDPAVGR